MSTPLTAVPEAGLPASVEELAVRAGLRRPPEAYLVQAGGTLNALATRFLGADVVAALEPAWAGRALAILGVPMALSVAGAGLFAARVLPQFREALAEAQSRAAILPTPAPEATFRPPADAAALYGVWRSMGGDPEAEPLDPFDGSRYGYEVAKDGAFLLWSSGPDGRSGTADDVERRCERRSR